MIKEINMTSKAQGIDVSAWQGQVDWPTVKGAGLSFVFAKATQSGNIVDQRFGAHWSAAKGVGLLRGAYHFFSPVDDPHKQAANFLRALGDDPGELPPVLDLESNTDPVSKNAVDNATLIQNAAAWITDVQSQLKVGPIIYTRAGFWNAALRDKSSQYPAWAAQSKLWVASYPYADREPTPQELDQLKPVLPVSWNTWTFWQYTESGRVAGISNPDGQPANVDKNLFNGSPDDLTAWARSTAGVNQTAALVAPEKAPAQVRAAN
jgi:lysozyme